MSAVYRSRENDVAATNGTVHIYARSAMQWTDKTLAKRPIGQSCMERTVGRRSIAFRGGRCNGKLGSPCQARNRTPHTHSLGYLQLCIDEGHIKLAVVFAPYIRPFRGLYCVLMHLLHESWCLVIDQQEPCTLLDACTCTVRFIRFLFVTKLLGSLSEPDNNPVSVFPFNWWC